MVLRPTLTFHNRQVKPVERDSGFRPVSPANAICEIGGWTASLVDKPKRAKAFYAVIAADVLLGLGID